MINMDTDTIKKLNIRIAELEQLIKIKEGTIECYKRKIDNLEYTVDELYYEIERVNDILEDNNIMEGSFRFYE